MVVCGPIAGSFLACAFQVKGWSFKSNHKQRFETYFYISFLLHLPLAIGSSVHSLNVWSRVQVLETVYVWSRVQVPETVSLLTNKTIFLDWKDEEKNNIKGTIYIKWEVLITNHIKGTLHECENNLLVLLQSHSCRKYDDFTSVLGINNKNE